MVVKVNFSPRLLGRFIKFLEKSLLAFVGQFCTNVSLHFWSPSVNAKFGEGSMESVNFFFFSNIIIRIINFFLFLVISY